MAFEQLKSRLAAAGLFDESHKQPIPKYPRRIGVATSAYGAAVADIKQITARRFPAAELVIAPTVVQGDGAPESIARSIEQLDKMGLDVLIVGRGGGSMEDLWAFNTETVINAVYTCKTPIISAVGHETDFTITDFVADMRAPTPSAARSWLCRIGRKSCAALRSLKALLPARCAVFWNGKISDWTVAWRAEAASGHIFRLDWNGYKP